MKILWLTNIPSPYRVDFFNELGKSCELTVLFEKGAASDRDTSWLEFSSENFQGIVLRGISYSAEAAASPQVLKHLKRGDHDVVVVTNFSSPTGALAIAYLKANRRRYYLESDGGFASGSKLKSWIKRLVIGGAQGYFSTSDAHDEYYLAYGARPGQLIRYPFTSVRARDVLLAPPSSAQKSAAKRALGITQTNMVLGVGRFIHVKGFDLLLKALVSIPDDTLICLVGGKPSNQYQVLAKQAGCHRVRFVSFKQWEELRTYYIAADVFALPTRGDAWGLVINEALAHALPVVTTDRCVAGLELVANTGCGFVVRSEDVDELGEAINRILNSATLRMEMQRAALDLSTKATIELMAAAHVEFFTRDNGRQPSGAEI